MAISVTHTPAATGTNNASYPISKDAYNTAHLFTVAASSLVANPTGSAATADNVTLSTGLTFAGTVLTLNTTLQSMALTATTGLAAMTQPGTFAARTITGTADQVIVANGNGTSGNPTLSLPQSVSTTSSPTFGNITATGSMSALTSVTTSLKLINGQDVYTGAVAIQGYGVVSGPSASIEVRLTSDDSLIGYLVVYNTVQV